MKFQNLSIKRCLAWWQWGLSLLVRDYHSPVFRDKQASGAADGGRCCVRPCGIYVCAGLGKKRPCAKFTADLCGLYDHIDRRERSAGAPGQPCEDVPAMDNIVAREGMEQRIVPTGMAVRGNEVKQRRDFSEKHFPGVAACGFRLVGHDRGGAH